MANIGYIVVCEDVYNDGDLVIKKPYNMLTPYAIPGNFSFVLAFSMFDLKTGYHYKLRIEIIDPNDLIIMEEMMDFEYIPQEHTDLNLVLGSGGANLKFNNIVFENEGTHKFRVQIISEKTVSKEITIPVIPSKKI